MQIDTDKKISRLKEIIRNLEEEKKNLQKSSEELEEERVEKELLKSLSNNGYILSEEQKNVIRAIVPPENEAALEIIELNLSAARTTLNNFKKDKKLWEKKE